VLNLTPTETERLLIFQGAELARRRRARGLVLNQAEAEIFLIDEALEAARDGLDLPDVIAKVRTLLTTDDVMPGVADLVPMIVVEGMFHEGPRLITVVDPIGMSEWGNPTDTDVRPGEVITAEGDIQLNAGAASDTIVLRVVNTSDRAIQITSHFHFMEVNRSLRFDRAAAFGRRLDIAAGTAVRFEPEESQDVTLIPIGGDANVTGHNNLVNGSIHDPAVKAAALERLSAWLADDPEGA
jgi:urease subunit gamma/beta